MSAAPDRNDQDQRVRQSELRGRQRGCKPKLHRLEPPKNERAYLGTGIYRVEYIERNGKCRRTPFFALESNARKALALMKAKGYPAIIVC